MASWYCKIDDVEHGPLSQSDLVKMAQQGRLSADDLVRIETKEKWYKARDVKGLKFSVEKEPRRPERQKTEEAPASATSKTANSLLKNLTRKGSDTGESIEVDSWETKERAASALSRPLKRKPLDRRTKRVLWLSAGAFLLLVLFPPHEVPEGSSLPDGWYYSVLFTPPVMKLDVNRRGMGNIDIDKIEIKGDRAFVYADMPIDWMWLSIEWLGVLVIAVSALGFLAARTAAADTANPKPAPPRRKV